ncbi:hypothetical protein GQ457_11G014270 [Hibiscus cannabinus]
MGTQKQESKGKDLVLVSDDDILESEPSEKVAPEGYKHRNRAATVVRDFPFPTKRVQTPFSQDLAGLVVRDFPFPTKRVQTQLSRDLVQPVLSDASEPTLESEYEAKEPTGDSNISKNNNNLDLFGLWSGEEGFDMPEVYDSAGLVDPSETSEEDTASSFISLTVPVNATDSTVFETKELSHKLSDAQSDSEEICRRNNLKNPENLPLRRSNRLLKKGPNTTEKPAPKSKEKTYIEAAPSRRRSKRKRSKQH